MPFMAFIPYLVKHVLHGSVGRRGARGDADRDRPLRQPVLRNKELTPAGLVLDGVGLRRSLVLMLVHAAMHLPVL